MASMRLTFLGTGTSHGVPMIGCECDVCTSSDPRDQRLRTSAVIHAPGGNILIDAGPDLRTQSIRHRLTRIESILFTHAHADHIMGLDDVRRFNDALAGPLPCHLNAPCRERLEKTFAYCLQPFSLWDNKFYQRPHLELHEAVGPFRTAGALVEPVPLMHGKLEILGFRVGSLAYCTDCKTIPAASMEKLRGLEVLVLGALRPGPEHPTHMSFPEALATVAELRPRRTYFVHMSHLVHHERAGAGLPAGVVLAHDGLTIEWD